MSVERIKTELKRRDERDSTRSNSPLMQAEDAIRIDTTKMEIEDQVNRIIDQISKRRMHSNENA
jgi:cytidylate kinase